MTNSLLIDLITLWVHQQPPTWSYYLAVQHFSLLHETYETMQPHRWTNKLRSKRSFYFFVKIVVHSLILHRVCEEKRILPYTGIVLLVTVLVFD